MTSKITPEAKARCAAHTMQEQLEQMRSTYVVEQRHDMREIDQMLSADDMAWSGQHARLVLPVSGQYARLVLPVDGAD